MAACDEGYPCQTCGQPVKNIVDSALYLHFVLGDVQVHQLFNHPERHLHCEPELAQYIVHEKFEAPEVTGEQDKRRLSDEERMVREERITAAWVRLREVRQLGIPITEYPLVEH